MNRNKLEQINTINKIYTELDIDHTCATGYGKK